MDEMEKRKKKEAKWDGKNEKMNREKKGEMRRKGGVVKNGKTERKRALCGSSATNNFDY